MSEIHIRETTRELAQLIWESDDEGVTLFLHQLSPTDLPLILSRLDASDLSELFEILEPEQAAGILENLRELSPHTILTRLAPERAARILHELPSNLETDLIAAMKPAAAKRILDKLPEREMSDVQALARYAPDVAGGLMATEILQYSEISTVQEIVDDLRDNAAIGRKMHSQHSWMTQRFL